MFGSLARGSARTDSDLDLAVSFGRPMPARLRARIIAIAAESTGRPVDLVDLEIASGPILASAMRGTELVCDSSATRTRLIRRLLRSEGDLRAVAIAARAARPGLFT